MCVRICVYPLFPYQFKQDFARKIISEPKSPIKENKERKEGKKKKEEKKKGRKEGRKEKKKKGKKKET